MVSEGEEEEEDKRKPYIDICQANRKDLTPQMYPELFCRNGHWSLYEGKYKLDQDSCHSQ